MGHGTSQQLGTNEPILVAMSSSSEVRSRLQPPRHRQRRPHGRTSPRLAPYLEREGFPSTTLRCDDSFHHTAEPIEAGTSRRRRNAPSPGLRGGHGGARRRLARLTWPLLCSRSSSTNAWTSSGSTSASSTRASASCSSTRRTRSTAEALAALSIGTTPRSSPRSPTGSARWQPFRCTHPRKRSPNSTMRCWNSGSKPSSAPDTSNALSTG